MSSRKSVWRAPGMPPLLAFSAFGFGGFAVMMPTAPLWVVHGGAGSGGAGLVNGVLMLATVVTQFFVPGAVRRFGWAPVLVTSGLFLGVPSLLHLLSDDLVAVLGMSALRGVGFGIITVCGSLAVSLLVEPRQRGRAIGAYGVAISTPMLVLVPAGPWLADQVGFWLVFLIGALPLAGVVPAGLVARVLHVRSREVAEVEGHHAGGVGAASVRLVRPMLLLLAATLVGGGLLTFVPQMTSDGLVATVALLVLMAMATFARWGVGGLADAHGTGWFTWPLVLGTAAGVVLVAWAVAPEQVRVPALLVGSGLVGLGYGGLQNLTLVDAFAAVRRRHHGLASTLWNVGFDSGTGLGSVLVGALAAGWGFPAALVLTGVLSLATVPLAIWQPRPLEEPVAATR